MFLPMEWTSLGKKYKKKGRRKRIPVEKLQTISWFYHLATLLEVNVEERSINVVCDDVAIKLVDDLGCSVDQSKGNLEHSCRDWMQGRSSPLPDTIRQISDLVESVKRGYGLKLWLTFFVGIKGCSLWCKFDLYSQDPYYDIPKDYLTDSSTSIRDLAVITENLISYHTKRSSFLSEKLSGHTYAEILIEGLGMSLHNASEELLKYGVKSDLYQNVCIEQIIYMISQDPIKYALSDYLKEHISE